MYYVDERERIKDQEKNVRWSIVFVMVVLWVISVFWTNDLTITLAFIGTGVGLLGIVANGVWYGVQSFRMRD